MLILVAKLALVSLLALTGGYTVMVGVRDGMLRRRIGSRFHRDGRELRNAAAFLHGIFTSATGLATAGLAVWPGLKVFGRL